MFSVIDADKQRARCACVEGKSMWRRKLNKTVLSLLLEFTISRVVQHYHEAAIAIVHFSIAVGTGVLLNESI